MPADVIGTIICAVLIILMVAFEEKLVKQPEPEPQPEPIRFVPFDQRLAAIGAIEPMFVRERVGWQTTKMVARPQEAVYTMGSAQPVAMLDVEYEDCRIPHYEVTLKWKVAL